MLTTALGIILIIGIIIILHELGHFLAAKIMGVKVEKFSVGFGPKLLSRQFGDTEYRLSLVPLGGYVKLAGEHLDEKKVPEPWEFFGQKVWRRAIILAAGPFMNFLLAWIIFCSIFYLGKPVLKAVIGELKEGEPAQVSGLNKGDEILAIDERLITDWDEMAAIVYKSPEKQLNFRVERDGEIKTFTITPRLDIELNAFNDEVERGLIGILPDPGQIYYRRETFPKAIFKGTEQILSLTRMIYIGIWKIFTLKISVKQLGGPILMAQLTAEHMKLGLLPLIMFVAVISLNLAIINLLPIPILDGGHLMFLAVEKIKGRPLSFKAQETAQTVGLFIIIALMLLATYNDILRFFEK